MNDQTKIKVSIIIPAYNEAGNITRTIRSIKAIKDLRSEIVVVDDGSTDSTLYEAKEAGAQKLVTHETNSGKGAAVRTGLEKATGNIIVIQDADMTFLPSAIPELVDRIYNGHFDIVYGSRFMGTLNPESMPFLHNIGNHIITWLVNVVTQQNLTDVMSGQKAFTKEALRQISFKADSWPDIEIAIKARKLGFQTSEVPIIYYKRRHGRSKMKTFRDGLWCVYSIFRFSLFN